MERSRELPPTHPGEILREDALPALGLTKTRFAELLGISRQALENILAEKSAVSPIVALKLGKLMGNGPEVWIRLQAAYDLDRAKETLGAAALAALPTLHAEPA